MTVEFGTVGGTPLAEAEGILAKVECVNPTGSIKDRIVHHILSTAIREGRLRPGMRIVEATSGNTGIALAHFAAKLGYPATIVMPEHMTEERKAIIRGLGAELVLVSQEGSFAEAVEARDRMAQDPDVFNLDQFGNPLNVECHEKTTGQEILDELGDRPIDVFVAGVGTGGTLMGVGRALRSRWPAVHIVAVEPAEAAVMTGGPNGPHRIYGIGDGFVPPIVQGADGGLAPEIAGVEVVSSDEAIAASHRLRSEFRLCCGISSGANWAAARRWKERFETVVTVFADGFSKYLSQGLSRCEGGRCAYHERCPEPIPLRQGVIRASELL